MDAQGEVVRHYRTCNLCEAMCGLVIETQGAAVVSIRGDKDDPLSRGHICPKATALEDVYNDPDRLRYPVRRTASGWERIGWQQAFDEVAARLKDIQASHGKNAVGIYLGNPNVHNPGSILYGPPFVRSLRTRNRFSATSVDQLPHHFAAYFMFGHQLFLPVPDIDRTHYFLIMGANPLASNGSLMTAPGMANRLKALQKRGGKFVVIDPRRTETAAAADEHFFIPPGRDALLLLSLLYVIFDEGLDNPGHVAAFTDGIETVRQAVMDYSPQRVAPLIAIEAETIRRLAREFAAAESAVAYGRVGLSMQPFGGLCQWLINVLNIITGNFDRPGGAMFTTPAFDVIGITSITGQTGNYGRWKSRVRGLPEFGGELPVSALAEEILTEGEGQIKALVTAAGNPVLSTPNGGQLDEALAGLEFMVSIDIYINETTRHAHIILPPTTGLETDHYDVVFHYLAVRNTAKYSPAVFPPAEGTMHDWQILRELRARLEPPGDSPLGRKDYFRRLPPHKVLDLGIRFGPYGYWGGRASGRRGLNLRKIEQSRHGIDLGALEPCLPARLNTPGKRINLAPEILVNDLERLEAQPTAALNGEFDLLLIGRRHVRSNNSWMHNSERLVRGRNLCTLMMHPQDASSRNISSGETVTVESRVGRIEIEVEVTPDIMPGVVSIPHGWGHNRPGSRMQVAQRHAGVSINDLTDDARVDELTGNAAFSGVPVKVACAH